MKKYMVLLVTLAAISLIFTTVSAAAANSGMSLDEIQKLAIANSKQAAIDDSNIKAKESALREARQTAVELGGTYPDITEEALNKRLTREVSPIRAETDVEAAKMIKQDNLEQLKLDIYRTVHNILLAGKSLDMENQKLSFAKERYHGVKVKYDKGLLTESDVSNAQYNVENVEIAVKDKTNALNSLMLELKRLAGISYDAYLAEPDMELKIAPIKSYELDSAVSQAVANSTSIYRKQKNVEAGERTLTITEQYFHEGFYPYDNNKLSVESARIDLDNAKKDLDVNIRNKYNDVLNKWDSYELALKYMDLAGRKLEMAQTRLDKGIISREDFLSEKESWLNAQYGLYAAICSFNIAQAELDNMINQ